MPIGGHYWMLIDILKCRQRCSAILWRAKMRRTVDAATPTTADKARSVQCVSPAGGADSAVSTTFRTVASGVGGFPGLRILSRRRPCAPGAGAAAIRRCRKRRKPAPSP